MKALNNKLPLLKFVGSIGLVTLAVWACKTTGPGQSSAVLDDSDLYDSGVSAQQVADAMTAVGAKQPEGQVFCGQACHGGSNWHEVTQDEIVNKWLPSTQKMYACFNSAADAQAKIACFQDDGKFTLDSIKRLGVYRAGVKYSYFQKMFEEVYPEEMVSAEKFQELQRGGGVVPKPQMPIPDDELQGPALPEEDFNNLVAVMTDARAEDKIKAFFGEVVASNEVCKPASSPELESHVRKMRVNGWSARLMTENYSKFHGCEYRGRDFQGRSYKQILELPIKRCFQNVTDPGLENTFSAWERKMSEDWDRAVDETGNVIPQNIKVLSDMGGCMTTFWMRSSPDGRYVGNGNRGECGLAQGSRGFIYDLKYSKAIGVNAPYDPGFFPDNKGFTFIASSDAHFCSMEALNPGARSADTVPDFFDIEAGKHCGNGKMGVYQHVGAAVDPAKPQYTVVRSSKYANDDGGASGYRTDPSVSKFAKPDSNADLYKMCDKNKCASGANSEITPDTDDEGNPHAYGITDMFRIEIPYEGDFGISPSSELLTSRIAKKDGQGQVGYRLRTYDLDNKTSKSVGTVCIRGGKASMSFNERFLVTHHFTDKDDYSHTNRFGQEVKRSDWQDFNRALSQNKFRGPEDPKFTELVSNSANIWISDVLTGKSYRLTFMNKGQFALYPHFRADGWMYFLVRDYNQNKHFVVATDAALQIELNEMKLNQ